MAEIRKEYQQAIKYITNAIVVTKGLSVNSVEAKEISRLIKELKIIILTT